MTTASIGQRLQSFTPIAHAQRMPPVVFSLPRALPAPPPVTITTDLVRALAGDDAAGTSFYPSVPVVAPGAHIDVRA